MTKGCRGAGIGKQLIGKAISEAKSHGVQVLAVGPAARNVEVIRLFHKMGFRNLGTVEMFIDLSGGQWKPGPNIFGCKFDY